MKESTLHFFLGHLSIEKLLKALYVKIFNESPPHKHDLVLLAAKCGLNPDEKRQLDLKIINSFNIEARYPDYKLTFYKMCTPDFVTNEMLRIGKVRSWIESIIENTH